MPTPTPALQRATSAERIQEAQAIQEQADALNKPLTEEEEKKIFALLAEADMLQADATRREQIEARVQKLKEPLPRQVRDPSDAVSAAGGAPTVPAEARNMDEHRRHGFPRLGEFAMAVYNVANPGRGVRDHRLDFFAAASGMQQRVGADGGFTVPPQYATQIWNGLSAEPNNLLSLCDQYTVEGESLTFPANAETSRATGSRFGGIQAYWLGEAAQITSSKPTFRQLKLEPYELACLVYVTDKLMRNSTTALDQYITRAASEEINFLVGNSIVNGDGGAKPKGIMNSGCLVTVSKEGSQAADTILDANLVKMWARLHVRARSRAVWLINQDVEPQLDLITTRITNLAGSEVVGGATNPIYNREKNTIKGRPVIPIEFCASIGDLGDIILADLGSYAVGVRGGGIESAVSMHLRFDWAEQAFRFMFSIDGQPWLQSALTPFLGTNTLSTFVTLQAR